MTGHKGAHSVFGAMAGKRSRGGQSHVIIHSENDQKRILLPNEETVSGKWLDRVYLITWFASTLTFVAWLTLLLVSASGAIKGHKLDDVHHAATNPFTFTDSPPGGMAVFAIFLYMSELAWTAVSYVRGEAIQRGLSTQNPLLAFIFALLTVSVSMFSFGQSLVSAILTAVASGLMLCLYVTLPSLRNHHICWKGSCQPHEQAGDQAHESHSETGAHAFTEHAHGVEQHRSSCVGIIEALVSAGAPASLGSYVSTSAGDLLFAYFTLHGNPDMGFNAQHIAVILACTIYLLSIFALVFRRNDWVLGGIYSVQFFLMGNFQRKIHSTYAWLVYFSISIILMTQAAVTFFAGQPKKHFCKTA